ncbi:ABC transporter substrate-binding protein [Aquisalibacillus elongatus]|uniref:ABC transporter substrate-binding protein n=1 Tax=Aquisalibacillus elongatus TaxID=485577 RepID=UPI000F53F784|nr:ABC transporter substrate-binding protein [Aquisalibacillus elongatus]
MDAPGPWGTGPFQLREGYSSIYNRAAFINGSPLSLTWLTTEEDRTPYVCLQANKYYWNDERLPQLHEVIFRNDLSKDEAIDNCMYTEGEVDLVTELPLSRADEVQQSPFAKLVKAKGNAVLTGVFNRNYEVLNERALRLALNYAVSKEDLIQTCFNGYADIVPALTPPWAVDFPTGLPAREFDQAKAQYWLEQSAWQEEDVFTIATFNQFEDSAIFISRSLQQTLGMHVELYVIPDHEELKWRHILAEKKLPPYYHLFLLDVSALFLEGTPAFFHREIFGDDGMYRVGPKIPGFTKLYNSFERETNQDQFIEKAQALDRFVYEEALGLFLCSPNHLYAVNRHVNFVPYRTTLEFAETSVNRHHWSVT